ncbi:MAG: ATP-binding protein [Clostridia bacterium]|nr:ATP-binding protein [Clostridia bacterium]
MELKKFSKLLFDLNILCVYRGVLNDNLMRGYLDLIRGLAEEESIEKIFTKYGIFMNGLLAKAELSKYPVVGDAWQNHVLDLILWDENTFSRKAEYLPPSKMGATLIKMVEEDLRTLQDVCSITLDRLHMYFKKNFSWLNKAVFHDPVEFKPMLDVGKTGFPGEKPGEIKEGLLASRDWGQNIPQLSSYYHDMGCGIFGRYLAFRWSVGEGFLPVENPDPITLDNLVGYGDQKKAVLNNTEQFVKGFPANNVLLYGDRGTGKSSTVKALIHHFGRGGRLRLIEVSQDGLIDLPRVMAALSGHAQRFIVFIDDLSFEEYETQYKHLKALLEGGVETRPDNVVVYATSNRRHLVKETFQDRAVGGPVSGEDIHPQDSLEEKISLADRFGVVVTYTTPDQETYLSIVEELAREEGIKMDPQELRSRALRWEMWHNGRSGRTASQFIQDLRGRMNLGENVDGWGGGT